MVEGTDSYDVSIVGRKSIIWQQFEVLDAGVRQYETVELRKLIKGENPNGIISGGRYKESGSTRNRLKRGNLFSVTLEFVNKQLFLGQLPHQKVAMVRRGDEILVFVHDHDVGDDVLVLCEPLELPDLFALEVVKT